MTERDQVVDVSSWGAAEEETLGTKTKGWLSSPEGSRWLFKEPRPATGDDWSEKAACGLAELLQLPHARVELASRGGRPGSISLDFTRESGIPKWRLTLGNELLWGQDPTYPRDRFRGVQRYTVDRVLDLLMEHGARHQIMPDGAPLSAPEVFTGYLLLDAWIGNQDRHHENFGMLFALDATAQLAPELAPSYDHAASLGQTLRDEERQARLETKDQGYSLDVWVLKACGALYGEEGDRRPLQTHEAFGRAARRSPQGASHWLAKLRLLDSSSWEAVLERLPENRPSAIARRFASRMLDLNRSHLVRLPIP